MSFLNTPISYFKNARETVPSTVTLGAFLKNAKHRDKVDLVRASVGEARDRAKKEVPAATISGVFAKRNIAGLVAYNGLVCLDFDAKENPSHTPHSMKSLLAEYAEVAYAGISVSGGGVFAIVPTNNELPGSHGMLVDCLGALFSLDGLKFDRACKDVCRLRFISYDDDPVLNTDPSIFDAKAILPRIEAEAMRPPRPIRFKSVSSGDSETRQRVEEYIRAVETSAQDVTNDYADWYRLGMSIASEFGQDGESYFIRLSQLSNKFDHAAAVKKYAELMRNGKSIKIGTFFQILKSKGVRL